MFLCLDERFYGREEADGLLLGFFDADAIPISPSDGPVNVKAFDNGAIPAELAAKLPSSPENMKLQINVNDEWWGDLKTAQKVQERWNQLVQQ